MGVSVSIAKRRANPQYHRQRTTHAAARVVLSLLVSGAAVSCNHSTHHTTGAQVARFLLKMPDGTTDIAQGSGLHFGRLGPREGLWLVCDRNAGPAANQVFFFENAQLNAAHDRDTLIADAAFTLHGPSSPPGDTTGDAWTALITKHPAIDRACLQRLRSQIGRHDPHQTGVDLEGITFGSFEAPTNETRVILVAEQPNSLILVTRLETARQPARLVLERVYAYEEDPTERGRDANDGLEAICFSGRPGTFFIAEEGTKPFRADDAWHYFNVPRLLKVTMTDDNLQVDAGWSAAVTAALHAHQSAGTHTINALCRYDDQRLLAVDRNGGGILVIDPARRTAAPWLDLYDPAGLNLRERLDAFPAQRVMCYVSIEGIARDRQGDLWLVDDPAMPEGFRNSCLVRLSDPGPLPTANTPPTHPAGD